MSLIFLICVFGQVKLVIICIFGQVKLGIICVFGQVKIGIQFGAVLNVIIFLGKYYVIKLRSGGVVI